MNFIKVACLLSACEKVKHFLLQGWLTRIDRYLLIGELVLVAVHPVGVAIQVAIYSSCQRVRSYSLCWCLSWIGWGLAMILQQFLGFTWQASLTRSLSLAFILFSNSPDSNWQGSDQAYFSDNRVAFGTQFERLKFQPSYICGQTA